MGGGGQERGSGPRSPGKWEGLEIGSACSSISRERREGVRGDGEDGAGGREIQYKGRPLAELDRKGLWAREGLRAVRGGRVDGAAE